MSKCPNLIKELSFGGLSLKNRIVLAPMTRARSGSSRIPNDLLVKYYEQRASAGLIISEGTIISHQAAGWVDTAGIYTAEQADGWKRVNDAVHKKGGAIFCQLWHTGRASHSSFQPDQGSIVGPSAIAISSGEVHAADGSKQPHEVPRALETEEISRIVNHYKVAAQFAKDADFDGVEIHSANGYLLDEFLQSSSNTRTDQYGGSLENRFRFLKEVIEAVCTVFDSKRVGVRLSPNGAFNGMGSEDNETAFPWFAEQLNQFDLGYLHVMDGLAFGFHEKCRALTLDDFRPIFKNTLMANCGYTRDTAEAAVGEGKADMVSFGRPYLANPDLVERFSNDWPLAEMPDPGTWYVPLGEKNFTDFEPYSPSA